MKETVCCDEGGERDAVFVHLDVPERVLDIDDGEPIGILTHVEAIFDQRNRIGVLLRLRIELAEIDAHSFLDGIVRLRHDDDWR